MCPTRGDGECTKVSGPAATAASPGMGQDSSRLSRSLSTTRPALPARRCSFESMKMGTTRSPFPYDTTAQHASDNRPLREDLTKLRDSADQLLAQIDAIVTLTRLEQTPRESRAQQVGFVEDLLRTVQPLHAGSAAPEAVLSSRVLVVDDNAANRDVLARRLTREGHEVVTAANGASALELVVSQEFDLVLLDLIMPEMNGFQVLRRLKATEHTSHVPVIVISALDELDSVVRCIESGAEDYLTKPFNPVLL